MKLIKIIEKLSKPFFQDIFPLNVKVKNHKLYEQLFFRYNKYFKKYYNFDEVVYYKLFNKEFKILCR
jgi:hypothetical protein